MAMKPDDQEIGALYREGGDDAPSAQLDAAILQAARAAVAKPAASAGGRRPWQRYLPVFATLLLAVMLGFLFRPQAPEAPAIERIALNETAAPAGVPARTAESTAISPPAAAPVAENRARLAEPPAPQPAAKMRAPMAAVEEARPVAATAGASAESRMTANADAAAPALAKSEASAPAAAPATRQSAPMQAVRPAGEWLTAIQKLLDQERIDEAKASLDAFRKAYPDTPLPPAIRQRLLP
jgi:hypothetical protein